MPYINRYTFNRPPEVETVDECETKAEAVRLLDEYRLADPSAAYAISSRSTKTWREAKA